VGRNIYSAKMDAEYYIIQNENTNIKKELDSLTNSTSTNSRTNTYFMEEKALALYINRVLLLVYGIAYLLMLFSLFMHRESAGILFIILMIVIFSLFPFFIDGITKYMYNQFISAMQLIYKGNAFYLYKPPDKIDFL
jgi:hypothetical protein